MIAFDEYIKKELYPISLKNYEYIGDFYNKYKEYLFDKDLVKKIDSIFMNIKYVLINYIHDNKLKNNRYGFFTHNESCLNYSEENMFIHYNFNDGENFIFNIENLEIKINLKDYIKEYYNIDEYLKFYLYVFYTENKKSVIFNFFYDVKMNNYKLNYITYVQIFSIFYDIDDDLDEFIEILNLERYYYKYFILNENVNDILYIERALTVKKLLKTI